MYLEKKASDKEKGKNKERGKPKMKKIKGMKLNFFFNFEIIILKLQND